MSREHYLMTQVPKEPGLREESFGFLIQFLARRIDATMKEKLQPVGIDIKLFANLMMLYVQDGVTQRELGAKLDFPEYYISRNVDSLVREGWAERRPDPNSRRSVRIFLTAKGRDMAAKLPAIIREANTEHLSSLTKDESAALIGLLQKVAGFGDP